MPTSGGLTTKFSLVLVPSVVFGRLAIDFTWFFAYIDFRTTTIAQRRSGVCMRTGRFHDTAHTSPTLGRTDIAIRRRRRRIVQFIGAGRNFVAVSPTIGRTAEAVAARRKLDIWCL